MRPNELPTHKQHEARKRRQMWWEKNGSNVIIWVLLGGLSITAVLDFLGVI